MSMLPLQEKPWIIFCFVVKKQQILDPTSYHCLQYLGICHNLSKGSTGGRSGAKEIKRKRDVKVSSFMHKAEYKIFEEQELQFSKVKPTINKDQKELSCFSFLLFSYSPFSVPVALATDIHWSDTS